MSQKIGIIILAALAAVVVLVWLLLPPPAPPIPAGTDRYWPMWRHDSANSGRSPLRGDLGQIRESWSLNLGGMVPELMITDPDPDQGRLLLSCLGGRVRADSLAAGGAGKPTLTGGSPNWISPLIGAELLIACRDLAGLGRPQVLVTCKEPPTLILLDTRDGRVLWHHTFSAGADALDSQIVKIDDLNGDGRPEVLVWPIHGNTGYALAFRPGTAASPVMDKVLWTARADETSSFIPTLTLGDLDGDGRHEAVVATYSGVYVFAGTTGSLRQHFTWPTGRNYGVLRLADLDGKPGLEAVILADSVREHLSVLRQGPTGFGLAWNREIEQDYPADTRELASGTQSLADFRGKGKLELALGIFNDRGDQRWHLQILDPLDGRIRADFPDLCFRGSLDLDGDGACEILAVKSKARKLPEPGDLVVITWKGGKFKLLPGSAGAVIQEGPPRLDARTSTRAARLYEPIIGTGPRGQVFYAALDTNGDGSTEQLACFAGLPPTPAWILPLKEDTAIRVRMAGESGTPPPPWTTLAGGDGRLRLLDSRGRVARTFPIGGFSRTNSLETSTRLPSPVVADLDGDGRPEIVVTDGSARVRCLERTQTGKPPYRQRWIRSGFGRTAKLYRTSSPLCADMNRDGHPEVVVGIVGRPPTPFALQAIDAGGRVVLTWPLAARPFEWAAGHFTARKELGLYVAALPGQFHSGGSFLFAPGQTGLPVWTLNYAPHAGYVGVLDLNRDGLDDLAIQEHFTLHLVAGGTGKDQVDPVEVKGYQTPILADLEGRGRPEILMGGGYFEVAALKLVRKGLGRALKVAWEQPFGYMDLHGRMPGVADVDGDGKMEVLVGPVDGNLHCLDGVTGKERWSYRINAIPTDINTADLDGDGRPEFIFGATDGNVYVLNGESPTPRRVAERFPLGYEVGDVIVADLDRDGAPELLAITLDGTMHWLEKQ